MGRAITAQPQSAEAHFRLSQHYVDRVMPFEAVWELVQTLALRQDYAPARAALASVLDGVYLPGLAQEMMEQRGATAADELERRLALARFHLRYGDAPAASQALQGAGDRLASLPAGLVVQGRVFQAMGHRADAEAAYRRGLKLAPGSAEGYYRLGRLLLEAGRRSEARAVFSAGRQAAPTDARMPFYLGLTYVPTGDVPRTAPLSVGTDDRARPLFEEALRLSPGHALPLYELGLVEARAGRWREAGHQLEAAVKADPAHAGAHRELARVLSHLKKHPYDAYYRGLYYSKVERPVEAIREFRSYAAARPDSAEGALLVSRMYIQIMQYRQAALAAEPALRRFPKEPGVYERLSVLYKLSGSRQQVERLCRQWQTALPEASEPFWVLGKLRVTDGRFDDAIRLYEQALAHEPERPEYLLFLGQALVQRGRAADLPRALDLIGLAVQKAPQDPAGRLQLGQLLQRLGRPEEAREQLLRSLDLDPHQAPAFNSLTQIAAQLRQPAQARFFGRAVRMVEARNREEDQALRRVWTRPRDPDAHLLAARFRRRTGELDKAKAHLEQALELRSAWPAAADELRRVTRALEAL